MNENSINNAEIKPASGITGFQKEIADIQTAIADFESGNNLNIAIISEPFSGKTTLIDEIERFNIQKVTRISFSSIVKNKSEVLSSDDLKRIVILDHCDLLYMRKIGGFEILDEVLKQAVSSNNLLITTWNLYSWNYLDEVVNLSKFFPVRIYLPKLTAGELKEIILSKYEEDEIKFTEDVSFEKEKLIEFGKYPVTLFKKSINIPHIKINKIVLEMKMSRKEETITVEDVIFDKIYHISNGNPGVAEELWQKSLEYPAIRPSRIKPFSFRIELDVNEDYILVIILSTKSIKKDELAEISGPEFMIDNILFRLEEQGLITINESLCTINPEALQSIVDYLKKSRLVW